MARTAGIPTKQKALTYRYEANADQGRVVKGTIKATTEAEAWRLLSRRGYEPTMVEIAPSMFSPEEAFPFLFQIKPRDVIIFSRQLATLLKSGISLLPALTILHQQAATSRAFKKIMESMIYDLRSGVSFSQALSKHPRAFSSIYTRTISVGEGTGNLETVLHRMADYQEKQSLVTQKIGRALTYPIIVLGVGLVVALILMLKVMPSLLGMFTTMKVALPLPTRILIGMTNLLTHYQLFLLIAGALLAIVVLWLVSLPMGKRILDRIKLRAPVIGPPTLMGELARLSRTMSVLITAGMKLQEIMEMLPRSTNNRIIRQALTEVNNGLLLGGGLAGPMSRIDLFPPLLVQMVVVGEESNTLDFTLGVVADFYETTAEEKASAMVGMIGPISTIAVSLFVGFIAVAVIMPIYSLTGAFG